MCTFLVSYRFSHHRARVLMQQGNWDLQIEENARICKLASDYIRKAEGCEEELYAFFANEQDADSLFIKMVEEFERCILSYFAFHWKHASYMISQVCVCVRTQVCR